MKISLKKKLRKIMWVLLSAIVIIIAAVMIFINQKSFGKAPSGERLERIKKSPNYRDGTFQNQNPTPNFSSDKGFTGVLYDFFFKKVKDLRPSKDIPTIKTNLNGLGTEDALVWMGHSSLYMQVAGKKFLVDPVLVSASPLSAFNKAFNGAAAYQPRDLPDADILILTHDHWDHLDYETMISLKDRVGQVICPLGVGEHLEYWGFDKKKIVELDWDEQTSVDGFTITALPARHFSGRGLTRNKSLWASFMIQSPTGGNIYLGGDSGYDSHYTAIKQRFGAIDLAILENGQYNDAWKYIHLVPEDLVKAVKELNPKRLFTVHNSKYALAMHAWSEPLENISKAAEKDSIHLMTPMIGEVVHLKDTLQTFKKWWQ
ncbi:MBL fold metallo-hydrolase [Niabella yanshanensis]|uniref:MBL fold metallo-hydrolase n=1 Tax=Niabella yanshanensis TaxID=577386 RepID=A0ABZ0W3J3_9BACT|nr:MBL fold metallo-hydrolase [Niabella yanshanensis]WQD36580.1 MBL fold metallo-hydrolase [Niabella yanshanensis]